MSQVKKLEVSILVLGQKKPSSFFTWDQKSVDFKKIDAHVHLFKDSSAKFGSNFRTEWKRKNNSLADGREALWISSSWLDTLMHQFKGSSSRYIRRTSQKFQMPDGM
ncbi:unnamed protein product [Trifolium pratense]|uniref:Uncharacterized protein n=1 Tax=Trifolium pratense TaxID=57577 RepID=A0ACB0JK69_TRIPR|nr:unnamed protein product [Trifolium pratense]